MGFWSDQWQQIRGSAKWHLLERGSRCLLTGAALTAVWASLKWWWIQPVQLGHLCLIWVVCSVTTFLLLLRRRRLLFLRPRIECVSQFPNGTGYKQPGSDLAMVVPVKNESGWFHSAVPDSQKVIARVDFFSSATGDQVEACYAGLWIGEQSSDIGFKQGQTKRLMLAVSDDTGHRHFFVPEAGCGSPKRPPNIVAAHLAGAMLTLKPLNAEGEQEIVAEVHISGRGVKQRAYYALSFDAATPGIWPITWRERKALRSVAKAPKVG